LSTLDLSKVQSPIVTFITITYSPGFFYRVLSQRALFVLRRDIEQLRTEADVAAIVHILPELGRVQFGDVEQWIREYVYVDDADREVLRRLIRGHFCVIFGLGNRALSMAKTAEVVKAALKTPSVRASTI
jgi:hypothetical protein